MKIIKKYVYLLAAVTAITLTACDDNNNFDKNAKELLNNRVIYFADSSSETYKKYAFEDNKLTIYSYKDKDMKELKDTQSYSLYYDNDKFTAISSKDGKENCKITTCENDDYVFVSCDDNDIFVRGWDTKSQALIDDTRSK